MTADLAWGIATWVVSSIAGGLIAAWAAGRRTEKVEGRLKALEDGVTDKAEKEWVEAKLSAVHSLSEKAAAREWVEGQLASERDGRARIHRAIEAVEKRLDMGDGEFKGNIRQIAGLATRLESTTQTLESFREALGQFVTRAECERIHKIQGRQEARS